MQHLSWKLYQTHGRCRFNKRRCGGLNIDSQVKKQSLRNCFCFKVFPLAAWNLALSTQIHKLKLQQAAQKFINCDTWFWRYKTDQGKIKVQWHNKINFRFPFDRGYQTGAEENTILKFPANKENRREEDEKERFLAQKKPIKLVTVWSERNETKQKIISLQSKFCSLSRLMDHGFRLSHSVLHLSPLSMLSCDVDREVSTSRYDFKLPWLGRMSKLVESYKSTGC